jgi:hypothetical protein
MLQIKIDISTYFYVYSLNNLGFLNRKVGARSEPYKEFYSELGPLGITGQNTVHTVLNERNDVNRV